MGESFDEVIRSQAQAFAIADDPVEFVAARVVREKGFANVGTARSGHRLRLDEPMEFGGGGSAPDPAEAMLMAIGASLSVTLTVHAAMSSLALETVEVGLSGKLDPERFFHPSPEPGGGVYDLEVGVTLGGRASREEYSALFERALQACPVLRSIDAQPTTSLTIKGTH